MNGPLGGHLMPRPLAEVDYSGAVGAPAVEAPVPWRFSLARMCLGGLLDLCLHGLEVEARPFLHRRELDGGPGKLRHLLLDIDETPELVLEPLEVLDGSGESRRSKGSSRRFTRIGMSGLTVPPNQPLG